MTNKFWKSVLLIGTGAFICLSSPAFAQKLDGGSSGGSAQEYAKSMQLGQEAKNEADKGADTGDGYGVGDVLADAAKDTEQNVADGYRKGFFTGVWRQMTSGITLVSKIVGNVEMVGSDKMVYTNPITGEQETYYRTIWGTNVATEGVLKGCSPLGIQIIENRSCIFCPLFAVLYDAANSMSELAFSKLAKSISNVMLVGFALIIVFKGLSFVSSLTKQDAPKFIMEVLTLSLKVIICFVLLSDAHQVYDYFIIPVLSAGLDFGAAMLFSIGDQFQTCAAAIPLTGDNALLPLALYAKLDCFIRSIQGEISIMQSVGSSLMCVGRHIGAEQNTFNMWDFSMVFQGLIIWGFAILLSLAFAFYLIDATVTLGLVGALMPLLIASWPFKWTTGYTKKGIETFLNTFFVYVFMGVVVSINVQLIGTALTDGKAAAAGAETSGTQSGSTTAPAGTTGGEVVGASSSSGAMAGLMEAISGNDIKKLQDLTDIGFGGFLILLCCCIFGFKFSAQATTLAEKMSGGGISINKIGSNIGGMAASGAMGVAKKATQPARKAAVAKANDLSNRAGGAIGKRLGLGKHGGKTGGGGGDGGGGGGGDEAAPDKTANAPAPGGDNKGGGGDDKTNNKRPNRGTGPGGGKGHGSKNTKKNNKAKGNLKDYKNNRKKGKK